MSTHVSIFSWLLISSSSFKYILLSFIYTKQQVYIKMTKHGKIHNTFSTYCNKVSNTFQHKVQKDILWVGEWVRPCRCWCASCLQMQKMTSPEITCNYSTFSHTNTVSLNWQPSWAFTSQSMCFEKKILSCFLRVYVFSLKLFHVSL